MKFIDFHYFSSYRISFFFFQRKLLPLFLLFWKYIDKKSMFHHVLFNFVLIIFVKGNQRKEILLLNLILDFSVRHAFSWKIVQNNTVVLIQDIIYPLLCISDDDIELFNEEPVEFVRARLGKSFPYHENYLPKFDFL